MTQIFHSMIAAILGISEKQIGQTLSLLDDGATIPFISRYRKEMTGGLDEVQIESIRTHYEKLKETAKRKETIVATIREQGKMTPELQKRIDDTWDSTALEDIYLPYKPKRKTRAEAARQKGLEPLATLLMLQREPHPEQRAAAFVKGDVKDADDALKGARDIIAEQVSENERARNMLRNTFARQALLTAKVIKGKEEEGAKYRDYFDCSEPLKRCSSHRLLAIRRAEAEGLLKVSISPNDEECVERLERQFVQSNNACGKQVAEAVQDAYKRLLKPSIETEFAAQSKELMKVPRMGAKAFEQCAGFLRIPDARNPLDNTAVHPESYHIVEQMAKDLGCSVAELIADKELRRKIQPERYLSPTVGMPTLKDILQELEKPGRDPRGPIKVFEFDKNVRTIDDLRIGMELPGIVGNITNFGAFVDIGIKENGLIHLSQLAQKYVSNPNEIVSIHQQVRVKVLSVDTERKRIQLTMIGVSG